MTPTASLGLDLSDPEVYGLISRIYWSRIAPQAQAGGLDPEDVFQSLLERLLRSNYGSAPYDPSKSSISNYSYISMTSGLRNLIDSKKRAIRRGWQTGEEDVSTWDSASVPALQEGEVWRRSILANVASGQEPMVAALTGMTDSAAALICGWELVAIQAEREASRKKPRRRRSRRPRKAARSRQVARRRVPRTLGPWELVGLREAAQGA